MKQWMAVPIAALCLLAGCGGADESPTGGVSADEARMLNEAEAMLGDVNVAEPENGAQ